MFVLHIKEREKHVLRSSCLWRMRQTDNPPPHPTSQPVWENQNGLTRPPNGRAANLQASLMLGTLLSPNVICHRSRIASSTQCLAMACSSVFCHCGWKSNGCHTVCLRGSRILLGGFEGDVGEMQHLGLTVEQLYKLKIPMLAP